MKAVDMTHRLDEIEFPVYASRKWDGVRAFCTADGKSILSSSGALFPQHELQMKAGKSNTIGSLTPGMEYEVLHNDGPSVHAATINGILKREWLSEDFFDLMWWPILKYGEDACPNPHNIMCHTIEELDTYLMAAVSEGWEGLMLRGGDFTYKHGGATDKCQRLMKIKFRSELRGTLIDWEKNNVAGKGYIVTRMLFHVNTGPFKGEDIWVGSGLTDEMRTLVATGKKTGHGAEIEYQRVGNDKLPRQPVFKRWLGDD